MQEILIASPREYAAFISYRHADNMEPGRQWATWLHQRLESYEIPLDLVGTKNTEGQLVPSGLYPVFRDEEELPAHSDLTMNIQRALENSRMLIVLCSPRAVNSKFVVDEIRMFKEMGKAGRILAIIIDGEPNASEEGATAGIDPASECLPVPLRYGLPNGRGGINWEVRTEPIAADTRPNGLPVQGFTSAAAYRDHLEAQRKFSKSEIAEQVAKYEHQLELTVLKVIAGAIGVPLGSLTKRDKARQLVLAKQRAKRLRTLAGAFGLIALLAAAAGVFAWVQKGVAELQRQRAEEQRLIAEEQRSVADEQRSRAEQRERSIREGSSRSDFLAANEALRRLEGSVALASLAKAVRTDPANREACERLYSLLVQRDWIVPVRHFKTDYPVRHLHFHPDHRRLVIGSALNGYEADGVSTVQVRDFQTGSLLSKPHRAPRADLIGILSNPSMSVLVPLKEHKGMPGANAIGMPAVDAPPWQLDGKGNWAGAYNYLEGLAVSPDGKFVLLGKDGGIALLERDADGNYPMKYHITFGNTADAMVETGAPEYFLSNWEERIRPLAVGSNDSAYWVVSPDGSLHSFTFDAKPSVSELGKLISDDEPPVAAAFTTDGQACALVHPNGKLFVLSCPDFKVIYTGNAGPFELEKATAKLEFIPGSLDLTLIVSPWSSEGRRSASWWQDPSPHGTTAERRELPARWILLPGGKTRVKLEGNTATFQNIADGSKLGEPMVHESLVEAVALLGENLFATGTTQGNVRIWKRISAGLSHAEGGFEDEETDDEQKRVIAISPDRKSEILAAGSYRSKEFSFRESGKETDIVPPRKWDAFRSADFSPDGKLLLLTGAEGLDGSTRGASEEGAIILRLSDRKQIGAIMSHQSCWWAGFDPSGKMIATTGDGFVQLWSAEATHTRSIRLVHDGVEQVIWNPAQATHLVSISPNDSVRLWNIESGALIREVIWPVKIDPEIGDPFVTAGFDHEGRRFFTLSRSGAMVWDAATLEALCDPYRLGNLPPVPEWDLINNKLAWRNVNLAANAPLRETLLTTADFIAGTRIGDDGSKQTIANQLELVRLLLEQIAAMESVPEAETLRSLAGDTFLRQMAAVPQTQIESTLAWSEKLIVLQDAVYNYTSPPLGSAQWVLNRNRLTDFAEILEEARAMNAVESDRLMELLLDQWQEREDTVAALTRWHFGRKSDENRRLARAALNELIQEVEADQPPVSKWIQEWQAELR